MDSTIVTPFYSLPLRLPNDRQDEEDNNSIIDISTLVSNISSNSSDSDYSDDDDSLDSLIEKLHLGEHERATELISNRTNKEVNKPHLKYFDAVVILATFNTSGSIILIPSFVKNWKKAAWLAYITTALAAAKAYGLLPFAFAYYEDEIKNTNEYLGPVQAAGSQDINWHDLALAVSAFAPNFILIEVMSDMKDKTACKSALYTSTVLQLSFYLVAGLVGVALWGWNVTDPVTLEIPEGSWIGLLLSGMVAVAVCLDYLIASKVVNDWTRRTLFPKWEKGSGCREVSRHFFITLLTTSISLGMVLAIPDLSTLVGVVTGVCAIGMNTWAIPLAWVWGGKVIKARGRWFMYAAGLVCLPYTIWVISATAYDIANTDYRSAENFFCKG